MVDASQRTVGRSLMCIALLCFLLAALALRQHQEPFHTWFYDFAWWSYILFVESFLWARGQRTLLFAKPSRFLLLLPLSVSLWLVFEAFNFRLQNWHYLELPPSRGLRWLGYTISFATVLPALYATRDLLDYLGVFRNIQIAPRRFRRFFASFPPIGLAMLVLALLLPRLFFPLVWLGFIFLFEPSNFRNGADSILRDLEQGNPRNLLLLLLSGFLCGILWECWNFWAGSKWTYTIPYLGFLKLFEMPILGFFGFPPFAVECYVLVNAFFLMLRRIQETPKAMSRIIACALVGFAIVAFDIVIYLGLDIFTVVSFRPSQ
jgi:hypothetical protein